MTHPSALTQEERAAVDIETQIRFVQSTSWPLATHAETKAAVVESLRVLHRLSSPELLAMMEAATEQARLIDTNTRGMRTPEIQALWIAQLMAQDKARETSLALGRSLKAKGEK